MPIEFDDFIASNYESFRESFLVEKKSGALDRPAPRATGEIEKLASAANIEIAKRLNQLLRKLERKISYDHDFDVNVSGVLLDDWKVGGASILNILPKKSIFKGNTEVSVNIYDNNNVSINVTKEVSELAMVDVVTRFKGARAFDKAYKSLKRIFKVISK